LRRSTTLWTWESAFRNAPRSTLIFIGLNSAPFRSVPSLTNARFRTAFSLNEKSPENPNILVFWSEFRSPEGGPKTQVKDHTKRGGKGQKKHRRRVAVFALISGPFWGILTASKKG